MRISLKMLKKLQSLQLLRTGHVSILDIGSSKLSSVSTGDILEFLTSHGIPLTADLTSFAEKLASRSVCDPTQGEINDSFAGELFEKIGTTYSSLDTAVGYKTKILDLNLENLPSNLYSAFDLVLNLGATKHILNQFNCFKIIHDATKIGGHIFHSLPASGFVNDGYMTYTGRCLFDIAGYNEYEVVDFWFEKSAGSNNLYDSVRSYQASFPALRRAIADLSDNETASRLNALAIPDVRINVVYRKIKDKPFWGALESSTSVGHVPDMVIESYTGNGTSSTESGVPTAPSIRPSLIQRVSIALTPFPALKSILGKTYRVIKNPSIRPVMQQKPITETQPAVIAIDQSSIRNYINSNNGLEAAIESLGHRKLVGLDGPENNRIEYQRFFQEAVQILGSEAFPRLPISHQISTITSIYNTAMSGVLREALIIADLIALHYAQLLRSKDLTEAQACRVYDCLYGLYFAGAQSLSDMRKFDSGCVIPFDSWLRKQLPPANTPSLSGATPRNVAYFINCAHFEKGNAVSPIVASLARGHSQRADRRVFVYAVQWISEDFSKAFDSTVTVREFKQDYNYDKLDAIAAQMRTDQIDVAISDLNSSVAASLFARRVAPLQLWISMGFPYWSLSGLDWALLPGTEYQGSFGLPRDRCSLIRVKQDAMTLSQRCPPADIANARAIFPKDAFVIAIFSRLIKVSAQLLDVALRLLLEERRAHLLIVGTGDPRAIYDFLDNPDIKNRVTFLHRNVDLNAFGPAVNAMFDTFPFHGGNVCREVNIHGKPVLSVATPDWEKLLLEERDPKLLARNPEELLSIALNLIRNQDFYQERSVEAIQLTQRVTDTTQMVDDVESAIIKAHLNWINS